MLQNGVSLAVFDSKLTVLFVNENHNKKIASIKELSRAKKRKKQLKGLRSTPLNNDKFKMLHFLTNLISLIL